MRHAKVATSHRWVAVLSIVLGVLGAGVLGTAIVLANLPPSGAEHTPAAPEPSEAGVRRSSSEATQRAPQRAITDTPIAELADPAWVQRIAAAGGIPERALAAYAGAALFVAHTNPSCGIGWNTLAAIGHVESEHGTLQGGRIDADGVARPEIIGIAISPDTDAGVLDHDRVHDRALGPMQFIPATWNTHGQDGNRDGSNDVHNIDDASLAAAMHLCEVGGDLTIAANWINAVNAYNSSIEYNNRVAEAANHYATLR